MAVRFAGTTDQLSYSGALPGSTNGATVLFWAYLSVDQNDWSTMSRTSQGGTSIQYIALDSTGTDSGWFSAGGSITGITFTVGRWHRVAATISGSTGTLYTATADGPVSVGVNTSMTTGDPTELGIGGRGAGDSSEPFNGRIAGWKAWTGALTRAEIEREWSQLWPVRTAGLIAAYPLLQSGVDGRLDGSGNGRMLGAGATAASTEDDPPVPVRAAPRRVILLGATSTTATAGFGSASGAAESPSVALVVSAGLASGSGAALAPSVSTSSSVTALAGVATGSASANAPTPSSAASSAPALGSATADTVAVAVATLPATATASSSAHDTTTGTASAVQAATATGLAHGPAPAVVTVARLAAGTGLAYAPGIAGTATLTFTLAGRVRAAWHAGFTVPRWTVERGVSTTWRMETVVMITRSVLSHEVILFGPIRYLVDGVSTSPTGLTVEAALTGSEAGDDPSSWSTAAWSTIVESGRNTYWAKVSIGPGSSIGAQPVGVRKGWVRITASGETPVLPAGYVEFI